MATKRAIKKKGATGKKSTLVAEGRKGKAGKAVKRGQRKNVKTSNAQEQPEERAVRKRATKDAVISAEPAAPISPELIPEIYLYGDKEIADLQIDQLSTLLPEVESLLTKKRHEIEAIEQYGQRLGHRFNQINEHWDTVFARVRVGTTSRASTRNESPMKNAKISVSRTFDWALREQPPLEWPDVKARALENALKKLVEDSQRAEQENCPFDQEILEKIQASELPDALIAYVDKHQKTYESKRKKNLVAHQAGSQAVLQMEPETPAATPSSAAATT